MPSRVIPVQLSAASYALRKIDRLALHSVPVSCVRRVQPVDSRDVRSGTSPATDVTAQALSKGPCEAGVSGP